MIKSPNLMSLAEQAKLFREGKLTAVNNVKSHLEIINNLNPQLNSFITVDSTSETGQLQVDEVNIAFSNITDQVRSLVQNGEFTDKEVKIHLAYFDTNEAIVGAINYFTGQVRNVSIKENIDDSTLTLVVASHWANWNLTKGRHFSDESQQTFSSGDKGMEFATQVKEDVRWGM